MERQRRLMREHASAFEPQPRDHELLVLTRGVVDEPVDPPPNADDAPGVDVLDQELRRVASIRRLPSRHVAALPGGRLVEPVPAGLVGGDFGGHCSNSNQRFSFVQFEPRRPRETSLLVYLRARRQSNWTAALPAVSQLQSSSTTHRGFRARYSARAKMSPG